MTHDILQTDIDLAIRLKDAQHSDEEIILALSHRGVDRLKAAQLVEDLRHGRPVTAKPSLPQEYAVTRRSRSKSRAREAEAGSRSAVAEKAARPAPRPPHRGRQKSALPRVLFAAVVLLAAAGTAVVIFQQRRAATAAKENQPGSTAQSTTAQPLRAGTGKSGAASLLLELQPDGLRIGGNRVSADNVLEVAVSVLGLPSRTNRVGQAGTTVYAYDSHGLLIYSKSGGTNRIVLDCEATGGASGTESPFTGLLKVEDQVIGPNTDPETLVSGKLELRNANTNSSVWSGRYQNLGLIFAYLKSSSRRLSLITIDLK